MKYWQFDTVTREVSTIATEALKRGGIYHIPTNAITVCPRKPKSGFAVVAFKNKNGTKYIEDYRGSLITHTTNHSTKVHNTLGPIPEDWTLKPRPLHGYWDSEIGDWVIDIISQKKEIAKSEYQWVQSELADVDIQLKYHTTGDSKRRQLTEKDWKTYAIALRDYTTTDDAGNPVLVGDVRPHRPTEER
ncbi:hypothetical protein [Vibrio gazogenes]|uniref:Virus tail fibre assembly protein, lambda gpK n=1 Tax=Vibrio gazogenes DSM 21264 = NBRC 103151 TaxID=1123492 RepID=A0A1M5C9X9_VIBGA|nr:hypothetical protein [Vibrio gazogenes]USP16279.1 hypothetical protein MKS89_18020 [Vibrio gazogenes]SHF51490.1 hypothetical protein SAMN02745781_02503 [Vibrio gazogenes DSM 21264] [Vibrio gazogenes DSM 21264 = NBRC 103151]SJN55396.1 hypothetical protein BQ6471_01534 [Vibrio gazogenes]